MELVKWRRLSAPAQARLLEAAGRQRQRQPSLPTTVLARQMHVPPDRLRQYLRGLAGGDLRFRSSRANTIPLGWLENCVPATAYRPQAPQLLGVVDTCVLGLWHDQQARPTIVRMCVVVDAATGYVEAGMLLDQQSLCDVVAAARPYAVYAMDRRAENAALRDWLENIVHRSPVIRGEGPWGNSTAAERTLAGLRRTLEQVVPRESATLRRLELGLAQAVRQWNTVRGHNEKARALAPVQVEREFATGGRRRLCEHLLARHRGLAAGRWHSPVAVPGPNEFANDPDWGWAFSVEHRANQPWERPTLRRFLASRGQGFYPVRVGTGVREE